MRSRVSDKKRKTIIITSVVVTIVAICILIWKLSSYTNSLHLDFKQAELRCTDVKVVSDGNFEEYLNSGQIPKSLVTDEVISALNTPGTELCLISLDYSIKSDVEVKEKSFSIEVKPTQNAKGKVYSYTPISDCTLEDGMYKMTQKIIIDKADTKIYYFDGKFPRPFRGPFSFEISYNLKDSDEIKKLGFSAVN